MTSIIIDLSEDMYCGTLNPECIDLFTCMLCYGIVSQPIKCSGCETLVCKTCLNPKRLEKDQFKCFKKCGSKTWTDQLSRQEKEILGKMRFRCQNDACEEEIPYNRYVGHLKKFCKHGTYEKVKFPEGECYTANKD